MPPVLGAALPPMDLDDPRVVELLSTILEAKVNAEVGRRMPQMRVGFIQDLLADGTAIVRAHGPDNDGTPMPFLGPTPELGSMVRAYRWPNGKGTPSIWAEPMTVLSSVGGPKFTYPGKPVFDVARDYGGVADGSTDNGVAIQSAINDAIAAGGGLVYLGPGTWAFSTPLTMTDASGVMLIGVASGKTQMIYTGTTVTSALWLNTTDGVITKMTGAGMIGITLDAGAAAANGLRLTSLGVSHLGVSCVFNDLVIRGANTWQVLLDCTDNRNGGDPRDNQAIEMSQIRLVATGSAGGIRLHGNSDAAVNAGNGANTSLNYFENFWISLVDGHGFVFHNADGNQLNFLRTARTGATGSTYGLLFRGSNTTQGGHARNNQVSNAQTANAGVGFEGTGLWTRVPEMNVVSMNSGNGAAVAGQSVVFGAGTEPPINTVGGERAMMSMVASRLIATGETTWPNAWSRVATEYADPNRGDEALRIYSATQNHMRLKDNSGVEWGILIGATGNLRLNRVANGGIVQLPASTLQRGRLQLASIAAGGNRTDTITLSPAFPDANYTVLVTLAAGFTAHHPTAAIASQAAGNFVIRTVNEDTAARSPILHWWAWHDD